MRIAALLLCGLAALAAACGGDDNSPQSNDGTGTSPRPTTAAPTRQANGPTAIVEPRSGPPGSEITITGSGWPSGVQVDLTGAAPAGLRPAPYATVTTDGSGSFIARFRLERKADGSELQTGRYDIIARAANVQVDVPFLVESRRPITGPGPGG